MTDRSVQFEEGEEESGDKHLKVARFGKKTITGELFFAHFDRGHTLRLVGFVTPPAVAMLRTISKLKPKPLVLQQGIRYEKKSNF